MRHHQSGQEKGRPSACMSSDPDIVAHRSRVHFLPAAVLIGDSNAVGYCETEPLHQTLPAQLADDRAVETGVPQGSAAYHGRES